MRVTRGDRHRRRGIVVATLGCVVLFVAVSGCVPNESSAADAGSISATLSEFIVSFARNAVAAWLL